jgi:hypothetical protein
MAVETTGPLAGITVLEVGAFMAAPLLDGDVVEVTVEQVGTLTNPVGTLDAARAAGARRIPVVEETCGPPSASPHNLRGTGRGACH